MNSIMKESIVIHATPLNFPLKKKKQKPKRKMMEVRDIV